MADRGGQATRSASQHETEASSQNLRTNKRISIKFGKGGVQLHSFAGFNFGPYWSTATFYTKVRANFIELSKI
jgi:hypothetical protein